jgi:inhibitor of KinA
VTAAGASADPALKIEPAGDSALLLRLPPEISPARFNQVMDLLERLRNAPIPGCVDLLPGYASVLVIFDPLVMDLPQARAAVRAALAATQGGPGDPAHVDRRPQRKVKVPVFYDAAVAPDLVPLAEEKGLSVAQLIEQHAAPLYRCHLIGFRPGFPFLGGLPPGLATPRLATPRPRVPAGSVAIAGLQTGIYPAAGPGGWRIVGRTPLVMFDPTRRETCLLAPGDRVWFVPIDRARFLELGGQLEPAA